MGVHAGQRYPAKVLRADLIESQEKGTPGISINFETPDGPIEHTIWLTPKTVERAAEDLSRLGADRDKLKSWTYLENIEMEIIGGECDITTIEEEYKGKRRIKVQWMNDRKRAAEPGKTSARAANLFGGPPPVLPQRGAEIDDESVPF